MDIPETRYAMTADGVHIAYQVVGGGPIDLLFAFGWVSNIDYFWELPEAASFLRGLATFSRLILFDRRGAGLSDRTSTSEMPSLEVGMDDIRAVLDAAGSERALLFGFQDGGMLCELFAASYPNRTLGLVLFGHGPRARWAPDYPWGWTDGEYDPYLERIERGWGSLSFAEEHLRWISPSSRVDPESIRRFAGFLRASASPGSVVAVERMLADTDVRHVLPTIQAPTLVIHNVGDQVERVGQAHYVAERIPGARLVELPGDEHTPFSAPAREVIQAIQHFAALIREEEASFDRVLATVLFTDIVGSTQRAAELGDGAWRELLERHHATIRAMLGRYRGTEINTAGDGFFATFDGPARGVKCAQAITEAVRPLGLEVRAGLHTGEVETIADSAGGIAVHIGARVGAMAGPSEVLVSSTVKDLTAGSGLVFEDAGEHELKGVPDRWHLYRVVKQVTLRT